MAGLDDLYAQIPISDIASKFGVDQSEVESAVQKLVPVLVGGLHQNAQDPAQATNIESAAGDQAARGLLGSGSSIGQLDQADGHDAIAKIFGGNDTGQVATALAGAGAGNKDLLQKLLPLLAPIVLAYIGQQISQKDKPAPQQASGGALNEVLGSILSGMSGGGNKSLANVLGNVLGSKAGDILGGLFGGKH